MTAFRTISPRDFTRAILPNRVSERLRVALLRLTLRRRLIQLLKHRTTA